MPVHVGLIVTSIGGAASERINVAADPLTTDVPTFALGFAPVGALTVLVTVTAPVAPEIEMPVPATIEVTPVLVIVLAPVAGDTEMPAPATLEVTPVLVSVIEFPNTTEPPPLNPLPAVTVTESLAKAVTGIPPEYPKVKEHAPVLHGLPVIENPVGTANATLAIVELPAVEHDPK